MNPVQYYLFATTAISSGGITVPFPTMDHAPLVDQDVAAILTYLRQVPEILVLTSTVEHLQVSTDKLPPYIIVIDSGGTPNDTFERNTAFVDRQLIIRVISQDTDTKSAQTIARLLHTAIYNTLQGQTLLVDDYRTMNLVQGPQEVSQWENVSSEVSYLHTGFRWLGTFAPLT